MKRVEARWIVAAAVAALAFAATLAVPGNHRVAASGQEDQARHLVVFTGGTPPAGFTQHVEALGGSVLHVSPGLGFATVAGLAPGAIETLRSVPGISAVEPDIILGAPTVDDSLLDELSVGESDVFIQSHTSPTEAAEYARQWNLRAIHADAAWAAGILGSDKVVVAVLDTGIDYEHPDLQGRVDLTNSRSLLSRDAAGVLRTGPAPCPASEPGDPTGIAEDRIAETGLNGTVRVHPPGRHPVTDYHSHGTAVSALIASNAHVLAGVTMNTTLLGVKVHDRVRRNCLSVYLEGIEYAADKGADVLHLSFPLEFSKETYPGAAALVNRAVNYAHRKGAVMVAAAGNAHENLDSDEDRFRFCMAVHVICVSATGPALPSEIYAPAWDAVAEYSNYGEAIDVAGPGGTGTFPLKIVPVWLACSQVTLVTNTNQAPS